MRASPAGGPPAAARALLSLVLPPGAIRESVLGDLEELYRVRADDPERGAAAARRWYWGQALRLAASYGLGRLRGKRYRGFTPTTESGAGAGLGLGSWLRDLRLGLRSLAGSPGFAVPALLILGLGMTAATSIFTVVDSIAFRPLDLPGSDRLVIVCEDHPRLGGACIASPANVADLRRSTSTVRDLGVARGWPFTVSDAEGSQGIRGGLVEAAFLRALQVRPARGRLFRDDEVGEQSRVALLSHAFWRTRYGGDPAVVGATIRLDGDPYRVVGVLPPGLELPFDLGGIQVWTPPHFIPSDPEIRSWRGFRAIGRLAPGASAAAADAELSAAYRGLAEVHQEIDDEWRLRVDPLLRAVVGDLRPVLVAFLGGAGLLLLIVCANLANLFLARGLRRRRELAVRAALGASRGRLVGLMMNEGVVLSALATGLALLLAGPVTDLLLSLAPPWIPRLDEVAVDGRTLAFAAAVGAAVTLAFGGMPALRVTSWNLSREIGAGGRSGPDRGARRLRTGFVVVELALSVVLLTSAGVLTRSFLRYTEWDPGFERVRLLSGSALMDAGALDGREALVAKLRGIEDAVRAVPGVEAVATASAGPLFGGGDGATPVIPGGAGSGSDQVSAWWFDVSPGYFSTLGVEVVRGRELTEADGLETPRVAVINERLASLAWPGRDPLGRAISLPEQDRTFRVVGVVADVPPLTPGEPPRPEIYWSNRQLGRPFTMVLVRTSADPGPLARTVEDAVAAAAPGISAGTPRTLAAAEERARVQPRFQAAVLVALALSALVLAAMGVYAVISYAVAARIREMGIRMALGATRIRVLGSVLRSSLGWAGGGIALGLTASVALAPFLRGVAHGVSPTDPLSAAAAAGLLLASAALASAVPAVRATRADPVGSIRSE